MASAPARLCTPRRENSAETEDPVSRVDSWLQGVVTPDIVPIQLEKLGEDELLEQESPLQIPSNLTKLEEDIALLEKESPLQIPGQLTKVREDEPLVGESPPFQLPSNLTQLSKEYLLYQEAPRESQNSLNQEIPSNHSSFPSLIWSTPPNSNPPRPPTPPPPPRTHKNPRKTFAPYPGYPHDSHKWWAAERIIAEKGNKFRIEWVGTNPQTGEPWEPTWEPKSYAN